LPPPTSDPGADPRQAGRRVEVPNQRRRPRPPRRHLRRSSAGSSPLVSSSARTSRAAPSDGLAEDAHALIAGDRLGQTGSVNAILSSILLHASPRVRMVLVDPTGRAQPLRRSPTC
jgi:hypothetical protein